MSVRIDLPIHYERQLQEIADAEMRDYRQQAAWLLCRAIEQAIHERDAAPEPSAREVAHAQAE